MALISYSYYSHNVYYHLVDINNFHPIGRKPSNMNPYYGFQALKYPEVRIQSNYAQGAVRIIIKRV